MPHLTVRAGATHIPPHTVSGTPHFTSIRPTAKITAKCLLKIGARHDLPPNIEHQCGAIV
ncbi:hypothetical protein Jiend_18060 [Micromonospora endophytica]|nr:hypothetical protein Jiend_18060 [Micromonospora endophytica]